MLRPLVWLHLLRPTSLVCPLLRLHLLRPTSLKDLRLWAWLRACALHEPLPWRLCCLCGALPCPHLSLHALVCVRLLLILHLVLSLRPRCARHVRHVRHRVHAPLHLLLLLLLQVLW